MSEDYFSDRDDPAVFLHTPAPRRRPPPPKPGSPRTTRHRHLTRIDQAEKVRPGYLVRITRRETRRARFFADAAHGDQLGSLAAALAWRDAQLRELGS